jgi:hypothetical protein
MCAMNAEGSADKYAFYGLDENGRPLEVRQELPWGDNHVIFHDVSKEVPVGRPDLARARDESLEVQAEYLVHLMAEGPHEAEREQLGLKPIFPKGTRIVGVSVSDAKVVEIRAEFPESFLNDLRTGREGIDKLSHLISDNIFLLPVAGFTIRALDRATGEFLPIDAFEPAIDWESGPEEPDWGSPPETWIPEDFGQDKSLFPRPSGGRPVGGLTGRTVYLNAGHGWTWRSWNVWGVQRGFVFNNIEDFSNADLVHGYVWAYLIRAGADVFTVREVDPNPNMVIVDNDDGAPNYLETGSWSNSTVAGFANGRIPYVSGQNPFSFGTARLTGCVVGTPTATATWIPTIPAAGYYNVYVSHVAFTNRSPQAHYRITHAGGESDYFIDQRRHRNTWIFIGRYYFEAGRNPEGAKVVLSNSSTSATHFVSADAVRFGGGRGVISRGTVGASPYPNHDNEAVYHLQFSGAPTSVYQSTADPPNDESKGWSGRPQFARWLEGQSTAYGAPSQPAVFLSNHTNAASGTARGTISYLYDGLAAGSIHHRYRAAVHNQVVRNLQQGYGGTYVVNSNPLRSGVFGEANPNNVNTTGQPTVPIFLGEWLFHDNAADMALYHDPKFRRLLARGIYQGIVDFWAAEIGGTATYLPEPPRNVRVRVDSPTAVTLLWQAPLTGPTRARGDAATGYKVYRSTHGRGFGMGTVVAGTQTTITGLTPGQTYYFQVTATNAGGESFPSETLAAKTPASPTAHRLLVVSGYDKLDTTTRNQTPHSGDILYRQFPDQMNTQDYIVEHARAIDASGRPVSIDSAEHDAVEAQLVSLTGYDAVLWIGGLQAEVSTADPDDHTALNTNTRTALTNYLNAGGRLFMTGAELAWDLNRLGQTSFMNNTLRLGWAAEGPQTQASGAAGSIFAGVDGVAFGGAGAAYRVYFPDVLTPTGGSTAAMVYGGAVGTQTLDDFETIGGWRQPSFSGQTNADPASTFGIVTTPVRTGSGSGELYYVWGTGDFIREYNSNLPEFPAASDFSIWVNGDNSGHRVRIALRDSDNEIFVNDWLTLNFTGWRELAWPHVAQNPGTRWAGSADNAITGPNVRLDSIQMQKVTAQASGRIYFDSATYRPIGGGGATGPVAGIQYSGAYKLVYLGFPFETILSETNRTTVMTRALDFLLPESSTTPEGVWWGVK